MCHIHRSSLVQGTDNPADLMTKHLTREKIDNAIDRMSQVVQEGQAKSSLDIQGQGQKAPELNACNPATPALSSRGEDDWEITGQTVSRVHVSHRRALLVPKGPSA